MKDFFKNFKKGFAPGMGEGHKLNEEAKPGASSSSGSGKKKPVDVYVPPKRSELNSASQRARDAALNRLEKKDSSDFNTSLAAIRAQAKRELQAEQQQKQQREQARAAGQVEVDSKQESPSSHQSQSVYFRCPLVSEEVLSKVEWQGRIKEFLYEQLNFEEKGLTSCLIIVNCNVKEKAEACKEIINKYIENIISHPTEEKYRKIRKGNKIFVEKVRDVEGALDFLNAAGFKEQKIDEDEFLIWMPAGDDLDRQIEDLKELQGALTEAEVISLEVDRNLQVLLPSQAKRMNLPEDFYRITPEELKKEAKLRADAIEQAQILKTKAMREREEQRALNIYRFAFIRVRFPDGIYIQGTFSVHEPLSAIYEFVQTCLKHEEAPFYLSGPTGTRFQRVEEQEKSLLELRLVPSVNLAFHYEQTVEELHGNYIKEELMMLIKDTM